MQNGYSNIPGVSGTAQLRDLELALHQYTRNRGGSHCLATKVGGLTLFRSEDSMEGVLKLFRPAVLITVQGSGCPSVCLTTYSQPVDQAICVAIALPFRDLHCRASARLQHLGLVMELNRACIREVVEESCAGVNPDLKPRDSGPAVLELSPQLLDCALRGVRLLDTPEAIPLLYPGIMREFCYRLLTSSASDQIVELVNASAHDKRVLRAIHHLRSNYSNQIRVEELASAAGMSAATFHRQFKSVTSMSPLQYQKQVRLLEARHLMMTSNSNVESVAIEVGYVSASQFSREYTRMFGKPPRRDHLSGNSSQSAGPAVTGCQHSSLFHTSSRTLR